ncbi:MAG: hypothetical protein GYB32_10105 [Algicola sp.]|nr:hypothetical protein [Algicola sp.]
MKTSNRIVTLPLRLALALFLYGILFRVMHWPYGEEIIVISGVATMILYVFRFLLKAEKKRLDYVKLGLVLLWMMSYIVDLTHLISVPYFFQIIILGLLIWWFIEEGPRYFLKRQLKDNGFLKFFYYGFVISAVALILMGILLKIQHWPYGSIIFTLGILLASLLLIVDYFAIKKT